MQIQLQTKVEMYISIVKNESIKFNFVKNKILPISRPIIQANRTIFARMMRTLVTMALSNTAASRWTRHCQWEDIAIRT